MKVWIRLSIYFLFVNCAFAQVDHLSSARQELNLGVQAYRSAQFEGAIEHFKRAALLDPNMKVAHLYLATAYGQLYVPGVETPENIANAKTALEQYTQVLRLDQSNTIALKGVAYINMQLKNFKEARDSYKRAAKIDPNDAEIFYSAGVVDWTMAFADITSAKSKLQGASPSAETDDDDDADTGMDKPKPDSDSEYAVIFSPFCVPLRAEHLSDIEDGLAMLGRATELRKDYDDAMVYMNLLLRLRADLQCGDKAAHEADIEKANDWSDKAMVARKKKAEEAAKKQAPANEPQ